MHVREHRCLQEFRRRHAQVVEARPDLLLHPAERAGLDEPAPTDPIAAEELQGLAAQGTLALGELTIRSDDLAPPAHELSLLDRLLQLRGERPRLLQQFQRAVLGGARLAGVGGNGAEREHRRTLGVGGAIEQPGDAPRFLPGRSRLGGHRPGVLREPDHRSIASGEIAARGRPIKRGELVALHGDEPIDRLDEAREPSQQLLGVGACRLVHVREHLPERLPGGLLRLLRGLHLVPSDALRRVVHVPAEFALLTAVRSRPHRGGTPRVRVFEVIGAPAQVLDDLPRLFGQVVLALGHALKLLLFAGGELLPGATERPLPDAGRLALQLGLPTQELFEPAHGDPGVLVPIQQGDQVHEFLANLPLRVHDRAVGVRRLRSDEVPEGFEHIEFVGVTAARHGRLAGPRVVPCTGGDAGRRAWLHRRAPWSRESHLVLTLLDRLHGAVGGAACEVEHVARLLKQRAELLVVKPVHVHAPGHAIDVVALRGDAPGDLRLGALNAGLRTVGDHVVLEFRLACLDTDGVLSHGAEFAPEAAGEVEFADDAQPARRRADLRVANPVDLEDVPGRPAHQDHVALGELQRREIKLGRQCARRAVDRFGCLPLGGLAGRGRCG